MNFFFEHVDKVQKSVNLKVQELKSKISKEMEKIERNYSNLHCKVDVIFDFIAKLVEYNTSYSTKLDVKSESGSKVFDNLEEFLSGIKESVSQDVLSNQSSVSQENIVHMILSIEFNHKRH